MLVLVQQAMLQHNGTHATDFPDAEWIPTTYRPDLVPCVEVAELPHATIGIRNSRYPMGPVLIYRHDEIAAHIAYVKAGGLDHLL